MYDPKRFWVDMDKPHPVPKTVHSIPAQEEALLKLLKTIQFKSVLDVGASVGRIAKLIFENFEIDTYHGVDLSFQRLCGAKHVTQQFKGDIEFFNVDYMDWKRYQKYDLVIAIEVLMHVKPEQLPEFFKKMVSESSKHIISLDYDPMPQYAYKKLAEWNFHHNYNQLYQDNKLSYKSLIVSEYQRLYHGVKVA